MSFFISAALLIILVLSLMAIRNIALALAWAKFRNHQYDMMQADHGRRVLDILVALEARYRGLDFEGRQQSRDSFSFARAGAQDVAAMLSDAGPESAKISEEIRDMLFCIDLVHGPYTKEQYVFRTHW